MGFFCDKMKGGMFYDISCRLKGRKEKNIYLIFVQNVKVVEGKIGKNICFVFVLFCKIIDFK